MREQYCVISEGRCADICCDLCPEPPWRPTPKDSVTLPDHYARFDIEPVRFIGSNKLDWFQGNIIKYVCRYDAKNGIEDLNKAKRYLEMYIKYLNNDPDWWSK